jgi:hypothetical protein
MTNREHLKQLRVQVPAARPDVLAGNRTTGADRKREQLVGKLVRERLRQGTTADEMLFSPAAVAEAEHNNALPASEASGAANLHDGWPYRENSGLIDRDLARSIRVWALTEGANGQPMAEVELHSYSQRQLLQMYVDHLAKVLERARPEMADPERQAWAAGRAKYVLGVDRNEVTSDAA